MLLNNIIENCGVIPVVVLEDANKAVPLAKALLAGGIKTCEVTFRTAAAEEAIRRIALNVPDMIVGAGTVVTKEQLKSAVDAGAKFIVSKFFPAENYGGLKTIKAISQPFPNIRFIPTGGISLSNLSTYLEFGKIAAVGGSWLCTKDLINEEKWDEITRLSKEAMEIFRKVRNL